MESLKHIQLIDKKEGNEEQEDKKMKLSKINSIMLEVNPTTQKFILNVKDLSPINRQGLLDWI